ncbi:MAG: MATE family efflux transporter [Rikenellaceae bacterium]
MSELRDSIDFGKHDIPKLFRKMLMPTLLGMIFSAIFIITDGIFVGQGVGSDALAAVNFVSPLSLISMGVGLMFGVGASVVASIHLSGGKIRLAQINITQASVVSSLFLIFISALILIFPDRLLSIIGCSETLAPLSKEYIYGFAGFMVCNGFIMMGGFFVRLNGAPIYAMVCAIVAAVLNILLDYIFIFPLQMGVFGAALATGVGTTVGVAMMIIYLMRETTIAHFTRVKISRKSLQLTARNAGYMCKLGASSFLAYFSIACMFMCGNVVFLREMGDAGVAAYSVISYINPLVLTLLNAIAQSAQPIISYNYGAGESERVRKTVKLALVTGFIYSAIPMALMIFFAPQIASLFMSPTDPAFAFAIQGLPLYASSLIPVTINIIAIGYFQSVEQANNANIITVLRGYLFMIACFAVTPLLWGNVGAWLATPITEALAAVVVVWIFLRNRDKKH